MQRRGTGCPAPTAGSRSSCRNGRVSRSTIARNAVAYGSTVENSTRSSSAAPAMRCSRHPPRRVAPLIPNRLELRRLPADSFPRVRAARGGPCRQRPHARRRLTATSPSVPCPALRITGPDIGMGMAGMGLVRVAIMAPSERMAAVMDHSSAGFSIDRSEQVPGRYGPARHPAVLFDTCFPPPSRTARTKMAPASGTRRRSP